MDKELFHKLAERLEPAATERLMTLALCGVRASPMVNAAIPSISWEELTGDVGRASENAELRRKLEAAEGEIKAQAVAIQDVHQMARGAGVTEAPDAGVRLVVRRLADLATSPKGWRVPKRGDRLRLARPFGWYGENSAAQVGDVVVVQNVSVVARPQPEAERSNASWWDENAEVCVNVTLPNSATMALPINLLEPA